VNGFDNFMRGSLIVPSANGNPIVAPVRFVKVDFLKGHPPGDLSHPAIAIEKLNRHGRAALEFVEPPAEGVPVMVANFTHKMNFSGAPISRSA